MNDQIKNLLDDLYKIDSGFKKYEKELIEFINQLVTLKPQSELDENFRENLKAKILAKAEQIKNNETKNFNFGFNWLANKKLFYLTGGGLVIIFLAITVLNLTKQNTAPLNITNSGQLSNNQNTAQKTPNKIVVKNIGGLNMLIAECFDQAYRNNNSDYIIEGIVEKAEASWNEERTQIFTYTELLIENYLKGAPFSESKLQIITPGGTVDDIFQAVEDQPIFQQGKKVRIYFKVVEGEFIIWCGSAWVEEI